MGIAYNTSIVRDGLVLYLDAANPKSYPGSGTIWFNLSGSNNGTLINGTLFDPSDRGYFSFDGVDDYIEVSSISNLMPTYGDSITYEVWSYTPSDVEWHPSSPSSSGTNIISRGTYSSYNGLGRLSTNNFVTAWYRSSSGTSSASAEITRDRWYHLVSVWDGQGSRLYIDGVLRASDDRAMTSNPNTGVISIGRQRPLGGNLGGWYNGRLNGIKIYNRALSNSEIKQNFNATRGRYGI